jgi:hypothetical protein
MNVSLHTIEIPANHVYSSTVHNDQTMDMPMEYYSTIKKNEPISLAGKWMELEIIMLCEISQIKEDKYWILSFIRII